MTIRTFVPGDEVAQVSIYNEAAAHLPRFKTATLDEVRRRCRVRDFDPATRFYALDEGKPVGYALYHATGRVNFPWCRKGYEHLADPLLEHVLDAMRKAGIRRAFAAYRCDWPQQRDFFLARGFHLAREMINYVADLAELPTPGPRRTNSVTPVTRDDIPALLALGAGILRVQDPAALEKCLFHNSYFTPDSLFALRNRSDEQPLAVGILVANPLYANPHQVDAGMPCFRLGAFGTEGLTHKRINGLFSVLGANTRDFPAHALDLLGYACDRVATSDVETFAAQVPSDATHLVRFCKSAFRQQGSFPIFEREI